MLFQHGIVGFALYLFLLVSLWISLLSGMKQITKSYELGSFSVVSAIMLSSFHLREIFDIWWWDSMLAIMVWLIWGAILIAPRVFLRNELCR